MGIMEIIGDNVVSDNYLLLRKLIAPTTYCTYYWEATLYNVVMIIALSLILSIFPLLDVIVQPRFKLTHLNLN